MLCLVLKRHGCGFEYDDTLVEIMNEMLGLLKEDVEVVRGNDVDNKQVTARGR